jgi:pimeloyl-ACP methyl ester carboxylesterase
MVAPGLKIPSQPFAKTAVGLIPSRLSKYVFTHWNTKIFEPLQWRGERMDAFEIAAYARPLRQPDRMKFMLELAADLLTEPDRTGHVGPVDIPSLLVWGAEDRTIPVQNAFDIQAKLPDTELFILEHSGHSPMEDTPEAFLEVFWDFHSTGAR